MLLGSASHIVIGATAPNVTRNFFQAFGFIDGPDDVDEPGRVDAPNSAMSLVRGLGHRTELEIVEADSAHRLSGYDLGPRGLDLYTSDLERSLDVAASTGADVGPVGVVEIGSMVLKQVTIWGPDGIPLVLIENTSRRASLLDDFPDELHSEIHSLVWAVADRDVETLWWLERGATKGMDLSFDDPAVAHFMRLPDPQVEVAMVMLANETNDPIRFEVLEFAGRDGASFEPTAAGIQAIGHSGTGESGRLVSPGGVQVDLRP